MGEDASIVVSVDDIKASEMLKLISQMAPLKERIRFYERKHCCSLGIFEDKLKQLSEDFERWDDFIEWKGYAESSKNLEIKVKKIEDANEL